MCTVPNSDGKQLADMFGSRDPERIIDALGELNARMAERAIDAMEGELPTEDRALDPTVSTALSQVFANGVKLAKLIDPKLSGGSGGSGTTVNIGITGSARQQVTATRTDESQTRELAATVIAELEAEGHQRSQITEDMVREKLKEYVAAERPRLPRGVVEGQVIEGDDDGL